MSLKDITTEFGSKNTVERGEYFFEVKKAIDDDIYQIIGYRYGPFKQSHTLISVQFMSAEKARKEKFIF